MVSPTGKGVGKNSSIRSMLWNSENSKSKEQRLKKNVKENIEQGRDSLSKVDCVCARVYARVYLCWSRDCCKSAITLTNHDKSNHCNEPIGIRSNTCSGHQTRKMREWVTNSFGFAPYWSKNKTGLANHPPHKIKKSKQRWITFNTQLKTTHCARDSTIRLNLPRFYYLKTTRGCSWILHMGSSRKVHVTPNKKL